LPTTHAVITELYGLISASVSCMVLYCRKKKLERICASPEGSTQNSLPACSHFIKMNCGQFAKDSWRAMLPDFVLSRTAYGIAMWESQFMTLFTVGFVTGH
jgi:hypothetical protein